VRATRRELRRSGQGIGSGAYQVSETLMRGVGIEIRGFGLFSVRSYEAYEGRNPRTGVLVHVKAKRLAFFKVGKELRERIHGGRPPSR
jgi:integration host factor subunit beta